MFYIPLKGLEKGVAKPDVSKYTADARLNEAQELQMLENARRLDSRDARVRTARVVLMVGTASDANEAARARLGTYKEYRLNFDLAGAAQTCLLLCIVSQQPPHYTHAESP